jgi:hypothetical protein
MKRIISLMLVAAFALVLITGCGGSPEDKMEKAQKALEAGDFDKAISICEDLLKDEDLEASMKKQVEALHKQAEAAQKAAEGAGGLLN